MCSCNKDCNCNQECGCKLTIPSFTCIKYDGPTIPVLGIITGDSLESVMNKLTAKIDEIETRLDNLEP